MTAETPYLKSYSSFTPIYEEKKKSGEAWPGFIDEVKKHVPQRAVNLPKSIHFLDPDVLRDASRRAGLQIERCEFFPRPHFPEDLRLDGRESVGLVALKT